MSEPNYSKIHTHNVTVKGIKYYVRRNKDTQLSSCSKCDGNRKKDLCVMSQIGIECSSVIGKNCYLKKMARQRVKHRK